MQNQLTSLRPSFVSRYILKNHEWVDHCEEIILERPLGGSGDSCVVSRLKVYLNEDNRGGDRRKKYIIKRVFGPSERHYERDPLKTEIKRLSYKIEGEFLSIKFPLFSDCIFARALYWNDETKHTSLLIEQDLIALGFPTHFGDLEEEHLLLLSVKWLASFHSKRDIWKEYRKRNCKVWIRGGYWSLDKRLEEARRIRLRWSNFLLNIHENTNKDSMRSNSFSLLFAARLERISKILDEILYPDFPLLPFTDEDEKSSYDSDESDSVSNKHLQVRNSLSKLVVNEMICHLNNIPIATTTTTSCPFLIPTLIHGDYKAENIFFNVKTNQAAVCDFQWIGFGLGILDIISLIFSSLVLNTASHYEIIFEHMLDCYCEEYFRINKLITTNYDQSRKMLQWLFEWGIVDYCRYVVGCGQIYEDDYFFLNKAEQILSKVDGGKLLKSDTEYRKLILATKPEISY